MKASLLVVVTLAACATQPASEPLRYPSLPPAPSASTALAGFDPASSLVVAPLVCSTAELPLPNALDDDCNGQVDDAPQDEALRVVLAYPQAAALSISLLPLAHGDAQPNEAPKGVEQPISAGDCNAESAYCTIQLATGKLARGRHRLLVRRANGDAAPPPAAVVVSIQSRGKVTTYLARIESGASELALGELALP